jgi:hypothetical protein
VIHMEKVLEEVDFLVGDKFQIIEELLNQKSFEIFSDESIDFLSDISDILLKSPRIREFPDVATFAFYCRKANINSIKREFMLGESLKIGRGVIFHVTPSNVPVNFAYSLFAGVVTGNINIVRVPTKDFEQVQIIVEAINKVLNKNRYSSIFSGRLYLVRYNRDSNATALFSEMCDVRVIWGGDNTINEIRKNVIPPKSTEITFSDRYSISIINSSNYINSENKYKIAHDFYNDTYLFDQNACTSPQVIYWLGETNQIESAKNIFWDNLNEVLKEKKFELQPILAVDKLTTFYSQAISHGAILAEKNYSNNIWRVNNLAIHNNLDLFKCNSGYFNEASISSLDELVPIVTRKFQTIGYFGFQKSELLDWIKKSRLLGVDRVVPIGHTMDFSMTWDGYDLISSFSRKIIII